MIRNVYLAMVPACNCLPSKTIYFTFNVNCFYNFNFVLYDMCSGKFCFTSALKKEA